MKKYLNLVAVAFLATSSIAEAAPNPASQDWVSQFVQNAVLNLKNYMEQIFVPNFVQNYIQNRTSYISYASSATQCTIGTDCPQAPASSPIILNTLLASSGALAPTYNSSTGEFTIQVSGDYMIQYGTTSTLLGNVSPYQAIGILEVLKTSNSVSAPLFGSGLTWNDTSFVEGTNASGLVSLKAGDVISLVYAIAFATPNLSGSTLLVDGGNGQPNAPPALTFSIQRVG